LGRGDVVLKIEDSYSSRRHAQLVVTADSVMLSDLGSSNGTFVNERKLAANAPEALADGGSFRIGNTTLALTRVAEQESLGDAGTQVMDTQQQASVETDSEGTAIDPDSQPEAGKEGLAPSHPSESKWELSREDGSTIEVPLGEMTLGRKKDATQVIEGDSYVSGVHCRLVATTERLELTDLYSTNGTFVNDARIDAETPWQLATGDILRIGQTSFTVANNKPTEGQVLQEEEEES
jgi:pSer/pThr/pTyr-binding forkhead associated (FHA) protein